MTISKGMFLTNCTSNLLLVTYHYLFMESIWWKVVYKQLCWTMNNFLMLTKICQLEALKNKFSQSCFFPTRSCLCRTTMESLAFIKVTLHAFVISITCALFKVDWLTNFQRWRNLIGLLEFQIVLSEILLTACAD